MKFRTILADPPWKYENFSAKKQGAAAAHYNGMPVEEMELLPVSVIAQENAALLLWCTWPKMPEGLRLIEAWGFRYVSGFPWVKMSKDAAPRRGIGWHTQSASEFILIGVRGNGMTPPVEKRQVGIIFAPIGKHSGKPDEQYCFAEGYGGPYLEMFARPDGLLLPFDIPGWTQIGNEITGRDIREDLEILVGLPQPATAPPETDADAAETACGDLFNA